MNFEDLEKICIGLYGTAWQAQLANTLNLDRRNIQNWKNQGVASWVFDALEQIVTQRKNELTESEKFYKNLKKELKMKQLVHTECVGDFVKVNFYCKELALPSRSAVLAVEIECGAKTYSQEIRFKGDYNYFNQVPSSARGATDTDCIKSDFNKLKNGEKLTIGSIEIIYEYMCLVRHAIYDVLNVVENQSFNDFWSINNMMYYENNKLLHVHYNNMMLELARLS